MHSTDGATDHELRQYRLSRFGLVLSVICLGFIGVNMSLGYWMGRRLTFSGSSMLLLVASAAFAALWILMRGAPRSRQFVRVVELVTLFIGTAAFSAIALAVHIVGNSRLV